MDITDRINIAINALKSKGQSRASIAKALNVHPKTYDAWLCGTQSLSVSSAVKLGKITGVDPCWLLFGKSPEGTGGIDAELQPLIVTLNDRYQSVTEDKRRALLRAIQGILDLSL